MVNDVSIEIALEYNDSYTETLYTFVNNINTHEGGTHLAGFRRGLTGTLKKFSDNSGLTDKLKFDISGDDFREGLTAIISVKVSEPQFEGQTKTKIGNRDVTYAVSQTVSEMLDELLSENEGVKKKAAKSGMPYGGLMKVYNRGMAAWRTGHRPGTTPQQWAFARVNSII